MPHPTSELTRTQASATKQFFQSLRSLLFPEGPGNAILCLYCIFCTIGASALFVIGWVRSVTEECDKPVRTWGGGAVALSLVHYAFICALCRQFNEERKNAHDACATLCQLFRKAYPYLYFWVLVFTAGWTFLGYYWTQQEYSCETMLFWTKTLLYSCYLCGIPGLIVFLLCLLCAGRGIRGTSTGPNAAFMAISDLQPPRPSAPPQPLPMPLPPPPVMVPPVPNVNPNYVPNFQPHPPPAWGAHV